MKAIFFCCVALGVVGCSNKAVYDNLKMNKHNQCMQAPAAEYDKCMQSMDQSYEDYERQRKEATKQ